MDRTNQMADADLGEYSSSKMQSSIERERGCDVIGTIFVNWDFSKNILWHSNKSLFKIFKDLVSLY